MYVLAPNQTVEKFPYSIQDLRQDNLNTSFPSIFSDELLADWNVFPVEPNPPEYDLITQNAIQTTPIWDESKACWVEEWQISGASEGEILSRQRMNADYKSFFASLTLSTVYKKIRAQATQDLALTVACTEFVSAMTSAKLGEPSEYEVQSAIGNVIATATLSNDDLSELQELLVAAKLDPFYDLSLGVLPEINQCGEEGC